jgi:hypothetical protein
MPEALSAQLDKFLRAGRQSYLSRTQVTAMAAQACDLEARADANNSIGNVLGGLFARFRVREHRVYERGNGHSWLADQVQVALNRGDADGGVAAARARLQRHELEVVKDLDARLEERTRAAREATESALIGRSNAELRAYEKFCGAGGNVFTAGLREKQTELRALTRTVPGGAGSFVPPLWLVEDYIPLALSGRPFANLWTQLPLPPHTDSINLPKVVVGLATGAQLADVGPNPGRDIQDNYAQGRVRTIGGEVNFPTVWLDQRPGDADAILIPMLLEDYNTQLNGELLLGASSFNQLTGIMPQGSTAAGNLISLQLTNNASGQQWAFGGTSIAGSLHYAAAQLLSKVATFRAVNPTAWVLNTLTWAVMCSAADQQSRPLVPPGPGALADDDVIGHLHGLPIICDMGLPASFSATTTGEPYVSSVTAGQIAATAGSGTFSPVLVGRWDDAFLWESEYRVMVSQEVDSGPLLAKVRLHNYVASIPNRFTWGGANQSFAGTNQGGGINNGGAVSYGALTQYQTNSPLQSGSGF